MFQTKLCDLLGIKYPIIQGALTGIRGGPRLAAAVSNAGGLGILATFNKTSNGGVNWITKRLPTTRAATVLHVDQANSDVIWMGATKFGN